MADNKRQSIGGKTQGQGPANLTTGPGTAAAMAPLDVALSGAIGARVRIITAAPAACTLEGTLFTACPVTNLVAINVSPPTGSTNDSDAGQTQGGDYHIIPISRIQSFQLVSLHPSLSTTDGPSFTNANPVLHPLDTCALKTREANAIAKLQEREAQRGKGVTREAQDLFDAFRRTMPTCWNGTSIVVADSVIIAKPYRVIDCKSLIPGDSPALPRVRKVLEMERKKIELRNASAVFGNSGNFVRHAATASKDRDARSAAVAVPNHFDPLPAPNAAGQRKGG